MEGRLRHAVKGGNVSLEEVRDAISRGLNLDSKDECGMTLFSLAVVYGRTELFAVLSTPEMLHKPLWLGAARHHTHLAISTGNIGSLRKLLEMGCFPNIVLHGHSLLAYALERQCYRAAGVILSDSRWRVEPGDSSYHCIDYVLFDTHRHAIYGGWLFKQRQYFLAKLLSCGVSPNIMRSGWTALCYVVRYHYNEWLHLLLAHRADVNAVQPNGLYPLATAVLADNFEAVTTLLKRRVNMCLTERPLSGDVMQIYIGHTPLVCAMINKSVVVVRALIEARCSLTGAAKYLAGAGASFRQFCMSSGDEDLIGLIETADIKPHRLVCLCRNAIRSKLGRNRAKVEQLVLPRTLIEYLLE